MDGKPVNANGNANANRQEIKDLIKSGKAFSFIRDEITKTYESPEGDYYVEVIASSDQEDLVGDIMSDKALKAMEHGFVGKTVFMNHRTNVPDDVFGSIVSSELQKSNGVQLLVLNIVVEKENEAAMKTWRMISGGRTKLGTSVTVLVKSSKPNPSRKGGIIIDDVETIEHSIVGVPCNRESLTISATAKKALELYQPEADEPIMQTEKSTDALPETETAVDGVQVPVESADEAVNAAPVEEKAAEVVEETMPAVEKAAVEATAEAIAAENVEEQSLIRAGEPVIETPTMPKALHRSMAMAAAVKAFMALDDDARAKAEMPALETKGLFNDLKEYPDFWTLIDILNEVRWTLMCRIWSARREGSTDFTEIVNLWNEALAEFSAASTASLIFWEQLGMGEGEDEEKEASITPEDLETAAELEKSLAQVGELIASTEDVEAKDKMKGIATNMLTIAQKAGIPILPAVPASPIADVTKSKEYQELATRFLAIGADYEKLEKELSDTKEDLEVTKAGLAVAVEATNAVLRQPLTVERSAS